MKRQFATVALSFALLLLLSDSPAKVAAEQSTSDQASAKTLAVAGLRDRVTVRRDERGIPYIEAKNDADLYFAQGYVIASDRLWQMDLLRRNERGELAEVLGNTVLQQDKQHRTLGFAQEVESELAKASPESRAVLEAYASGVNAYIATLDARSLPPEFQILQYQPKPWTPAEGSWHQALQYKHSLHSRRPQAQHVTQEKLWQVHFLLPARIRACDVACLVGGPYCPGPRQARRARFVAADPSAKAGHSRSRIPGQK